MSNVYSTAQVAELMGVSADTVRTWKKRNADKLTETTHWLKDESNALLWTEEGIQVLTQLQSGSEPSTGSTNDTATVQAEPCFDTPLLSRYEPLLDMIANAVAPRLQQQLDQKVIGKVQGFATNAQPLTAVECVELLTQLGLKPANPAELLAGQNTQALPESK
jgi:DNA-binding transcriptional MerR regulator